MTDKQLQGIFGAVNMLMSYDDSSPIGQINLNKRIPITETLIVLSAATDDAKALFNQVLHKIKDSLTDVHYLITEDEASEYGGTQRQAEIFVSLLKLNGTRGSRNMVEQIHTLMQTSVFNALEYTNERYPLEAYLSAAMLERIGHNLDVLTYIRANWEPEHEK